MKDTLKWPHITLGLFLLSALPAFSQQMPHQPQTDNTDKRLRVDAGQSALLRIHGTGAVWKKLTGLSTRRGLVVRDRRLINEFLSDFRCTDTITLWSPAEERDIVGVEFVNSHGGAGNTDEAIYLRHGTHPIAFIVKGDSTLGVFLRPGYGQRFEDFLHRLAKKAHTHSRTVSYFRWGSG